MTFELIIEKVDNGFLCYNRNTTEEGGQVKFVIKERNDITENDDVEATQELLYSIVEYFGIGGSKHDARRISIGIEPGDKYLGTKV